MRDLARRLAVLFFAGAVGGLVGSLVLWLLGAAGVTAQWGISLAPPLTLAWLETRVLVAGLWGLLLVPFFHDPANRLTGLGAALSLLPTCQVLFVQWPEPTHAGTLSPLLVGALGLTWGLVTAGMTLAMRDRGA